MTSPNPNPNPTPEPRWNPGRLLESLTYFDVLPFSDTMRWLQSLWSGTPAASSSMLFSAAAVQACRSVIGLIDPSRSLSPQLATLGNLGVTVVDLTETSIDTLSDRDRLVALIVYPSDSPGDNSAQNSASSALNETLDRSLQRLNADLAPQVIFDFCHEDADLRTLWGSVDDVVMGGVSESQAIATPSGMVFSGVVSTANSGGFASIRTRSIDPPLDLRGIETGDVNTASDTDRAIASGANTGIELRLIGDGNRYKFILRDRDSWDGIAHCYSFETQRDTPMTVRIPFADCVPTFRAKSVPDCPRIDGGTIAAFQFMLSKFEYDQRLNPSFQPGAFRLLIESIAAYRTVSVAPILMVGESAAIAIARTSLGDRAAGLTLNHLDLNTAIVSIPSEANQKTATLEAILRHLESVV